MFNTLFFKPIDYLPTIQLKQVLSKFISVNSLNGFFQRKMSALTEETSS